MEELERCLASLDGSPSAEVLARARSAAETIKQELEMHKQAAATRQKTGQDWQTIASERETEAIRLRAEINRMRQAIASSTQAHGSQAEEIASLQAQLQEALAINKAQQRQAVVTTSAVDGPNAELHRLRAELEGRTAQLQQMEAELANQTAVAATRLNEMQDTFSNKITEMRRMHQQQLEQAVAAARAAAASEAQGRTGPRAGAAAVRAGAMGKRMAPDNHRARTGVRPRMPISSFEFLGSISRGFLVTRDSLKGGAVSQIWGDLLTPCHAYSI
ncbi:hypothetical protein Vafri_2112 [Volvox africanus]|nr:hypothetical protein Vafri_2112 [Volvox africanus]